MKSSFRLENTSNIEATMKLTMTLGTWEKLRDQLRGIPYSWPASDMIRNIDDLFSQASKVYYPAVDEDEQHAS